MQQTKMSVSAVPPATRRMYVPNLPLADTLIQHSARSVASNLAHKDMIIGFLAASRRIYLTRKIYVATEEMMIANEPKPSDEEIAYIMGTHSELIANTSKKSNVRLVFASVGAAVTVSGAFGETSSYVTAKLRGIYSDISLGNLQFTLT